MKSAIKLLSNLFHTVYCPYKYNFINAICRIMFILSLNVFNFINHAVNGQVGYTLNVRFVLLTSLKMNGLRY